MNCSVCKKPLEAHDTYEYRGCYSCEACFDALCVRRDREREAVMREERAKTEVFRGLDLGDSVVGAANQKLLSSRIEVAGKESPRLRDYEGCQSAPKRDALASVDKDLRHIEAKVAKQEAAMAKLYQELDALRDAREALLTRNGGDLA